MQLFDSIGFELYAKDWRFGIPSHPTLGGVGAGVLLNEFVRWLFQDPFIWAFCRYF